jgi:hypothetical protein
MRLPRIALCLLLAASGCVEARTRGPNADVRPELPRTLEHLGGGLALFAATVVAGGGVRASAKDPRPVVVDVSREFEKQNAAPGRVKLGKQTVTWTGFEAPRNQEEQDFESPVNGTRIIAFGDPSSGSLKVYGNMVFADTEANRANASLGRAPREDPWIQGPLFVASLGLAFIAIFVPWFNVKLGVSALAVSVALWMAYEMTIPRQVDIRVDLVFLFPVLIAAAISITAAGITSGRRRSPGE